jgi:hypothetical protein
MKTQSARGRLFGMVWRASVRSLEECRFALARPPSGPTAGHIDSLLIANAHHIVAQQYLLMSNLVEERARNVARVHDAQGAPIVI